LTSHEQETRRPYPTQ